MTRILGPEAGDRLAYVPGSTLGGATGRYVVIYAASTGSTLADICTYDGTETPGAAITGSQLTVDADSLLPLFWFPDDSDTVWAGESGDRIAVRARSLTTFGGTLAGKLVVNATSASAGYPLGRAGAEETGLSVPSSFAGGEDSGAPGTFDSTGRINLYSHQRADVGSFGEVLRIFAMRSDSKQMIAWYMPRAEPPYNAGTELPDESLGWNPVAWIGAHYEANDGLSVHGHWSVEIPDTSNALQTRLEIPFVDQEGDTDVIGVDITNIRTHSADFTISADSGVLRVGGGSSYNKDILLSHSSNRAAAGERWKLRADTTAEAGSNVGTDFSIRRHSDNGTFLDTALFVKRSTGNIAIAGTATSAARVTANWGTSGVHGFYALTSGAIGNGAAFATLLTATTERIVDARISGDGTARVVILGDGKLEIGDGSSRDTNLYRSAANKLKTDDMMIAALGIGVGNSATAASVGTLTRKIEVFDAAGASLGFVPVYGTIT